MNKITVIAGIVLAFMTINLKPGSCDESDVFVERSTDTEFSAVINIPEYMFSESQAEGYSSCTVEGYGHIKQPGSPAVPARGILIDVPIGADVTLSAEPLACEIINDVVLEPVPERNAVADASGVSRIVETFEENSRQYSVNRFFPAKTAEIEFLGYLRDRRVAKVNIFPLQYNPVLTTARVHTRIRLTLAFSYSVEEPALSRAFRTGSAGPRSEHSSVYEHIYSSCLLNYTNRDRSGTREKPAVIENYRTSASLSSIKSSPFAVKIITSEEGMCKVTYERLENTGVDLSSATHENLVVENRGEIVPTYCSGSGDFSPGDYLIFYAEDFKSLYAKKNVYWLYQDEVHAERMQLIDGTDVSGFEQKASFTHTAHEEEDFVYEQKCPNCSDHYFWTHFNVNATDETEDQYRTRDYTVYLENFVPAGSFSLTVNLKGETSLAAVNPDHHTKIYINNNLAADFTWDGNKELVKEIDGIDPSYFVDGANTITVEAVGGLSDSNIDSYFLNWFELSYSDRFIAEDDLLQFSADTTSGASFTVEGFTDSDIMLFDVTSVQSVKRISGTVTADGSSYSIAFGATGAQNRTYYAVSAGGFVSPDEVEMYTPSDITGTRDSVDYIIITHEDFYNTVLDLQQYRESQGLTVEVVKIQDIYDSYSHGIKDASAIKDFLAHAYTGWHSTDHPAYVVLVGDASIDYRDDLGYADDGNRDYVSTYIYETDVIGDTPTDNWFVCVSGDDYLPDMVIGRMCVKTQDDLENIISKIKAYEQQDLSPWQANVILAADNEDMFESISEGLIELLPEGYNAKEVYIASYDKTSSATDDLITKINSGAVLVNYTGHGGVDVWADEDLLQTPNAVLNQSRNDMELIANRDKLHFLIVLNCLSGFFAHYKDEYCLAEEFARAANKGAIACLASTSSGFPSEHRVLGEFIYDDFFTNGTTTVGPLVYAAKINTYNQVYSRDIVETFTLFGDPATELKLIRDFGDFSPLSPDNTAALAPFPQTTFSWGTGLYERFKLQFSTDSEFLPETVMTVPLFPYMFLSQGTYTPNLLVWTVLRLMCMRSGTVYWRVVAYDDEFEEITNTTYRSFTIQQ